jgi:hypothetical protein
MSEVRQLPAELQRLIHTHGTPLTFQHGNAAYILQEISVEPLEPSDGYRASIDDFSSVFGEGNSKEAALTAFDEVLRAMIQQH